MQRLSVGVLLSVLLLWAASASAGVIAQEDFENAQGLLPKWDVSAEISNLGCASPCANGSNPRIVTDTYSGWPISGTHSLLGDYTGGAADYACGRAPLGCGTYIDLFHTPALTEVWTRQYILSIGFQYANGACCSETKQFFHKDTVNTSGDFIYDHWYGNRAPSLSKENGHPQSSSDPCRPLQPGDVGCNYRPESAGSAGSPVQLQDGVPYCIETHVKNNTAGNADGSVEIFVTPVGASMTQSLGFYNQLLFDTPIPRYNLYRLYVQAGIGKLYYDDIAVGDTRIGCGVVTDPVPGAPATPTGFGVH